ncbi:MAG: Cna B-type domain-containing protein [Eubacteriales bacterium]|nr:Cna B-type domain-containing protein [Christensenellaceae bacterium]MDY2748383.1 Cna B-type domain-containing protein [Eubacteriales bacterium]
MKKYTKLMGILLALVMLVALMPMTALAVNQTYPPNPNPPTDKTKVEVEKIARGLDETKEYKFNFKYYQVEDEHGTKPIEGGANGNFSIIVKWNDNYNEHSGSFTIENLDPNIWLAIEEIDPVIPEGYRLFAPDMVTVYTESSDNKRDIYNIYEERNNDCDVVISKAVEGNDANVNDEFEFEVTFYMPKEEYERPIAYSANAAAPVRAPGAGNNIGIYKRFANGDTYEFRPGELTYEDNVSYEGLKKATLHFTLKHGESLSIIGLAIKNRLITVNELDSKGYLTTVNGIIGTQWKEEEPIADTIKVDFINTKESLPLSESLSVEKRWSDGNDKHMRDSVTVQLYRNGEPYSLTMFGRVVDDGRVELSAANRWQHTWSGLDTGYKWTVAELNVPKGYVSTVNYYGGSAIITNTATSAGLPQTGDAQTPYIGAGLVLAAMAIVVIIAGKKRN